MNVKALFLIIGCLVSIYGCSENSTNSTTQGKKNLAGSCQDFYNYMTTGDIGEQNARTLGVSLESYRNTFYDGMLDSSEESCAADLDIYLNPDKYEEFGEGY